MENEANLDVFAGAANAHARRLRVVVILPKDSLDARPDVETAIRNLNLRAATERLSVWTEVVAWCTEDSRTEFCRESPAALIEAIRNEHKPHAIIGIFWSRFGEASCASVPDAGKAESISASWSDKDHPRVLLYFNERNPVARDEVWHLVREFRGLFEWKRFWWWYKKRPAGSKNPRENELGQLIPEHLLPLAHRLSTQQQTDNRRCERQSERRQIVPLAFDVPSGWEQITTLRLGSYRQRLREGGRLSPEDAESYFNGASPDWRIAVSESVPLRRKVCELKKEIADAAYDERMQIMLLMGAGGEGKSTILRQVAVEIAETCPNMSVIFRRNRGGALGEAFIRRLLTKDGSFVIVSDDAQEISDDIYDAAMLVRDEPHHNIQFLLASKTLEWYWRRRIKPFDNWGRVFAGYFKEIPIRGLDLEDATEFAKKWKEAGTLGVLAGVPEEGRAQFLYELAREEQGKHPNEGSLLGAMLTARKGMGAAFENYVAELLDRLGERTTTRGKKLQDAFAYIVALHADAYLADPNDKLQCPPLFKPILQHALSCANLDELEDEVIHPLADEAAISPAGDIVLARHYAIAEAAKKILSKRYPHKFGHIGRGGFTVYTDLLRAAIAAYRRHKELNGDEIAPWHTMEQFYFNHHQTDLALLLAEVAADEQPSDQYPISMWTDFCMQMENYKGAVKVFRDRYESVAPERRDKGLYYEWGVAEGHCNNECFAVWLKSYALSDDPPKRRNDAAPPMMRLSGLSLSLRLMCEKTSDAQNVKFFNPEHSAIFLRATGAGAQLGLEQGKSVSASEGFDWEQIKKSESNLKLALKFALDEGFREMDKEAAFDSLWKGIRLAWQLRGKDDDQSPAPMPTSVFGTGELYFSKLKSVLGIKGTTKKKEPTQTTDFHRPIG